MLLGKTEYVRLFHIKQCQYAPQKVVDLFNFEKCNNYKKLFLTCCFLVLPPNEHVQLILGGEVTHGQNARESDVPCLFTEMEELKFEYGEMIWREAARLANWNGRYLSILALQNLNGEIIAFCQTGFRNKCIIKGPLTNCLLLNFLKKYQFDCNS